MNFSRIIFLDVDGVLNCSEDFKRIKHKDGLCLDEVKIQRLNRMVDATGAKCVLSSTWRRYNDAMEYLRQRGVKFCDTTPISNLARGFEIESWMKRNPTQRFVILDDDSDMLHWQSPFFIQTKMLGENAGLQDKHVERAIKILNAPGKYSDEIGLNI